MLLLLSLFLEFFSTYRLSVSFFPKETKWLEWYGTCNLYVCGSMLSYYKPNMNSYKHGHVSYYLGINCNLFS